MKLIADYHTHTSYSHGTGTVEENVRAAKRRKLTVVGIADHGPANLFGVGVKKLSDFLQIKADVFVARRQNPGIRILVGAEANVISTEGDIDIPEEILEHLDYLLVGLHPMVKPARLPDLWHLTLSNFAGKVFPGWNVKNRYYNTRALVKAVQRYPVLAVTHPGYRLDIDTRDLAVVCAQRGTA
ncbi:MAG: PHP domain-containing protein, partial [Firmicutes bacterium]|nr:PHP domain-containing protein [Bacillota bacterium]